MHDLADAYLTFDCCRELQGIKSKHQLVVFDNFVGELESIGDELARAAPSFGACSFYSPQARFQAVREQANVDSNTPCRVLCIFGNARRDRAGAYRTRIAQRLWSVRCDVR